MPGKNLQGQADRLDLAGFHIWVYYLYSYVQCGYLHIFICVATVSKAYILENHQLKKHEQEHG